METDVQAALQWLDCPRVKRRGTLLSRDEETAEKTSFRNPALSAVFSGSSWLSVLVVTVYRVPGKGFFREQAVSKTICLPACNVISFLASCCSGRHPGQWQCQAKCKPAKGARVVRHTGTEQICGSTLHEQCEDQRQSPQISLLSPKSENISDVGRESARTYMFPVLHSCRLSRSNTGLTSPTASYVSSTTRSDLLRSSSMVQEHVSPQRFLSQELPIQSQVQPFLDIIAGGVSLPG
ncbi:hypothetical protein TGGT1_204055 [Toxoplasma gondii GT1]|uniref:Uncharacterized protein n=3 Tax=Toxoplasma gondii TaxID=5811 RepID=S7WA97_TOXGG|nr:hypothetical protein TGGT1_204055 [Toxoplasma gondii GT1]KFG39494.1 hypothetical protein TGFOU_204055 [Toxoplasma gondii FOU]RQX73132.1 hypothetical protein TGCAST_204055 [Toxoplasma gondii CAST]